MEYPTYKHVEGFFKWGTHTFAIEVPLLHYEDVTVYDPYSYHFFDIQIIAARNNNSKINMIMTFTDGTVIEFDEDVDGFGFFINHMEHGQYMLWGLEGLSDKLKDIRKNSLPSWNTLYTQPRTLKSKIQSFFWIRKYILLYIWTGKVRNLEPLDSK